MCGPITRPRACRALESDGRNTTGIRPWFWILVLLASPLLGTVSFQYYILAMSHALTTSESILTQLIFDYSLRVRVKAESSEKGATPDSQTSGKGGEGGQKANKATSSFTGRLTNLVTIDLTNITDARDLLFLCGPLVLSITIEPNPSLSLGHARRNRWWRGFPLLHPWLEVGNMNM